MTVALGPAAGTTDELNLHTTTSENVGRHFSESRLVKTLNHIGYHDLEEHAAPPGTPSRRALAIASNDEDAAIQVRDMLDRFGFDGIYSGALHTGRAFEPGTQIFDGAFRRDELASILNMRTTESATQVALTR